MLVKVMENRLEKSNNTNAEESQSPNVVPVSGFAAVVNGAMNNNISSGPVHQVNRSIQLLAQKYGSECRNTFEDLSRIVQVIIMFFFMEILLTTNILLDSICYDSILKMYKIFELL